MFTNTVETQKGCSLAKAVLDASFDHHCVGDTITPNVWWLRLFKGGDDLEKMAVQLDKVNNIIRWKLVNYWCFTCYC